MKEKFNPLISIIIPVYNGSNYLNEAIDSAIAQTYKNIEILVINDGSNDFEKTAQIAKSYGKKIKYFEKENGGVASALNLGISKMKGTYFSWLSHDDKYTPDKISNQIAFLSSIKDKKSLVTSNFCYIDKNGAYLYEGVTKKDFSYPDYGIKLLLNFVVNGCSILIHKSYFEKYGTFNENLPTTQDYEMWFRILKNNKLYFLDKVDVLSRAHDDQGSKKEITKHIEECNILWINIVNLVEDELKIKVFGSVLTFYEKIYNFLISYTLYDKAILNVREKLALEIASLNKKEKREYIEKMFSIEYFDKLMGKNSNKKRLVFGAFGDWADKGGLNRVVANIANELTENYDIIIFASGNKKDGYSLNSDVTYINVDKMRFSEKEYIEIFILLLLTIKTDVYINLYNCSQMYLNILSMLNRTKIKTIVWNHEFYFLPYSNKNYYKICETRNEIFKKSDIVLWLTKTSNYVYNQFSNNSIVMHNALTIENNQKEFNSNKKNTIITAARFDDKRKNLEGIIYVAYELKKIRKDFEIIILGNYDLNMLTADNSKTLNDLIIELNIGDKLNFKGFVSNIENMYSSSKLNLLTSYHEGFGLTIIEAAQYGLPTIAFNDSGFEDMITNNKNGFLFDRSDYCSIASKIDFLFNNDEVLKKVSIDAYDSSKQFSKEKIVEEWFDLLENLFSNNMESYIKEKQSDDLKLYEEHKNTIFKNSCLEYENSIRKITGYYEEEIFRINGQHQNEICNYIIDNNTNNMAKQNNKIIKQINIKEIYRKLPLTFRKKVKQILRK